MSAADPTHARLLDQVLEAELPLSSSTLRDLVIDERSARTAAELALASARDRAVELLSAINCHRLLLEQVPRCRACTALERVCARHRELERDIKQHLERAAALAR